MVAKLLGVSPVRFQATSGELIEGTNLFVCYPEENVTGNRTDKYFISKKIALPKNLNIGDNIDIIFNRFGKPEAINAVK